MYNDLLATFLIDKLTEASAEEGTGLFGGRISVIAFATLCIFAALAILCAVFYFVRRDKAGKVLWFSFLAFTAYALIVGILLLALKIRKDSAKERIVWLVFVPIIITLALILASSAVAFVLHRKSPDKSRGVMKILISVCLAAIFITLVLVAVYYYTKISDGKEYYTEDWAHFNSPALYVSAFALVAFTVAAGAIFDKTPFEFGSKTIAYAGVCVALSFALSYVKLFRMPQGGSVTLVSMLPIMIFAYAFGLKKGLVVGLVYGILQSVQDPYIIHPAQFLLDYPIAFTMLGTAGLFSSVKVFEKTPQLQFGAGALAGGVLRYVSHIFSGVFAFGSWADTEKFSNLWLYSIAYNSYVLIDVALVIVAGAILLSSKSFRAAIAKK